MADPWPFESVDVVRYTDAAGKKRVSVQGDIETLESYLGAFGAAPAVDGNTGERCIVKLGTANEWLVEPPAGRFPFERPAARITAQDEVRDALIGHEWVSVGWTVGRSLVSAEFSADGQGFCRFGEWGFDEVIGNVVDRYWTYALAGDRLQIVWEGEGRQEIEFQIRHEFSAFSNGRGLGFTEVTLQLSAHPFPPSVAKRVESWPKDYWGTPKTNTGTR